MTQAKEELEVLLNEVEAYRQRNELDSVTLTVTGHGTGHAYARRGATHEDISIGAWKKNETPGVAAPRESR